jgi:hypothetical protein
MQTNAAIIGVGQSAYTRRPEPGQSTHTFIRDAVLTALDGRELETLDGLMSSPTWRDDHTGRAEALKRLAGCVTAEGKTNRVARLLDLAGNNAGHPVWQRAAVLDGLVSVAEASKTRKVRLPTQSPFLTTPQNDPDLEARSRRIYDLVTWP